jgi:uncharacterized protein
MYCIIKYMEEEVYDLSDLKLDGFEWDKGNIKKNVLKHEVTNRESEEIFFNQPILIFLDTRHSQKEKRMVAYGITDNKRKLTIVSTIRTNLIRIILARDQHIKERRIYEKDQVNT